MIPLTGSLPFPHLVRLQTRPLWVWQQDAPLGGAQQGAAGVGGAMRVGQSTVEIKKAETQEMDVE